MAVLGRGFDDTIIDAIVTALNNFCTAQKALCTTDAEKAAVNYTAKREYFEPVSAKDFPLVNVWADGNIPDTERSAGYTSPSETVTINVDLIAGADTDDGTIAAGQAAFKRLAYLKTQIKNALYKIENTDFGLDAGQIADKTWPRWTLYKNENGHPEESIVGGRWSFDVTFAWEPLEDDGTDLKTLYINTGLNAAEYTYNS